MTPVNKNKSLADNEPILSTLDTQPYDTSELTSPLVPDLTSYIRDSNSKSRNIAQLGNEPNSNAELIKRRSQDINSVCL